MANANETPVTPAAPVMEKVTVTFFQAYQVENGKEVLTSKKFSKLQDGYKAAMGYQQHLSQEKDVPMKRGGDRMNETNPSRRFWQGAKDDTTFYVSVRKITETKEVEKKESK